MNNRGYIIIALMLALGVGSALGLSQTKWNLGYEKAIRVDVPPVSPLYYSISGVEDKIWFDLPTVQDRAGYLYEYCKQDPKCSIKLRESYFEGKPIACNVDGTELYLGVDK